jgi:hypothetical protein
VTTASRAARGPEQVLRTHARNLISALDSRQHHTMDHLMIVVTSVAFGVRLYMPLAVVATLSKGYDLDYIWRPIDRIPF